VGAALAKELGWEFVDLDTEFEKQTGHTITAFFSEKGEDAFRAVEAELVKQLLGGRREDDLVAALGGGALERSDTRERLRQAGVTVVLLDVDPEVAWRRVGDSGRPLATNKECFVDLWYRRQPGYKEAATWVLPAQDQSVEDIAAQLSELVRSAGELWSGLWGRRLPGTPRSSLIVGGRGAWTLLSEKSSKARDAGIVFHVVSDANVIAAWGEPFLSLVGVGADGRSYVVKPGEVSKSVTTLEGCWDWLAERKARRNDIVLALGGGVVGDLAGFAAATFNRGLSLWQVPTTLIAQVDSSVGGKTAVNLKAGKNLVGAFHQPDLVVIDPSVLCTLPETEFTGGLGEVVKHSLLDCESAFEHLEVNAQAVRKRDETILSELVKRNVFLKAAIVERDERDQGQRAVLNLGHTTAHALEASLGYGAISHGSAVALGLLVALAISERLLGLDPRTRERTTTLLGELGLETELELPDVGHLLQAAAHDKKVTRGSTGFVGLQAIGEPIPGVDVGDDLLAEALEVIRR
jgi:shikimate kinase/3-dehydroquinate synthase